MFILLTLQMFQDGNDDNVVPFLKNVINENQL